VSAPDLARRARGGSLFRRIFLATAAAVVVVLAIVLGALSLSARRTADAAVARGLAASRRHVDALLAGRERALASGALVFAQNPLFRGLVLARGEADLLDQAVEATQRTGATWVQIADSAGVRLAKSDEPAAPPVTLAGTALVGGALAGEVVAGAGVAGDTALFQGVAVPIAVGTEATRVVGVLVAAQAMDSTLVREIRDATGSEVLIYLLDTLGTPRAVAATLPAGPAVDSLLAAHAAADSGGAPGVERVEVTIDGTEYVGEGLALRSAGGDVLGGVLTFRSRAVELAPFDELRDRIVLAGVVGLALACALSYMVARRITRPILALTAAARRAGSGDFAAADVAVESSGEIGTLADAVQSVLYEVRYRHSIAEFVAGVLARPARAPRAADAPPRPPSHTPFTVGRVVARRYEIERVLGVGGAGVVYRATDLELGETVAIKTLRPEVVAGGAAALERFKDEIRLARRLSHPNVVRIHDLGEDAGTYFITMEYVAGVSLHELLERAGALPAPVTLAVGRQLCHALAVAHSHGVIHRDIKPQNIMLQPDGLLKVMDFGVARLAERIGGGMTVTGMVVGTPAYMAPEQLLGEEVDARADVYAAGVALYECLTGRRPIEAETPQKLIGKLLTEDPVPPHLVAPDVPPALSGAVLRAIARDRDDRPASAGELGELLARAGRSMGMVSRAERAAPVSPADLHAPLPGGR
jgi:eukaryotic-like serine/threonine-protein kinase